jgi:tRNA1Val (adenine37-N6)-methyltransferase
MSNQYFQFKQFTIQQDRCAMKVSTDACIQGAWTPVDTAVQRVLDIGTGTGLLALMLAQRAADIYIDAVELDNATAQQAKENIAASPFADRVYVVQGDINNYTAAGYDLIICNPPFFSNSLLGDNDARNTARHTITLTHTALMFAMRRLLNEDGYASVLLPFAQQAQWELLVAQHGLYMQRRLLIRPYAHNNVNRIVSVLGFRRDECVDEELVIYKEQNSYTTDAMRLLGDFYGKEME